ncbi:MAG: glycosyltransferase family 39 protein, partial [Candidatus Zixiibacteriota bacterium]
MPAENKNFLLKTKNVFGIVAFTLILRFVFLFLLDLLPEEAYYWNYSQHLDIGYLDHPPMVAWLQWLSTSIFGDTEFGVRLPAFLCWFVAAWFIFKLTARLFDRTAGYQSILLMAVLPIYFSIGFIMTPDAPLYAAWAGALYFMARALVDGKRSAWYGIGLFIGLGMLSKYSIGLLGLSGFAFIIIDKDSRKWLLRPEPYLSIILALIIFSPVLIWNYQHDWASFR